MRIRSVIATLLLGAGLALLEPRLLPDPQAQVTIISSLDTVKTALDSLDIAVQRINGSNPTSLSSLADQGTKIRSIIKIAQSQIDGAGNVSTHSFQIQDQYSRNLDGPYWRPRGDSIRQ